MKSLFLLGLLVLLSPQMVRGQIQSVDLGENGQKNSLIMGSDGNNSLLRSFDNRYEGVEGSPYYFDYLRPGKIWMTNQAEVRELAFAYNIQQDRLEFVIQNLVQTIPLELVSRFSLSDTAGAEHLFVLRELTLEGGNSDRIPLQVIYEGQTLLYRHNICIFKKADYKGAYSSDQRADEFKLKSHYYLKPAGETDFQKIRLNRSSLLKALENQKTALKAFIKAEKLYTFSEAETIKLLAYFDTL